MNGINQGSGMGSPLPPSRTSSENSQPPWMELTQGFGQIPGFIDVPFEERKPISDYLYAILYRKWIVIAMLLLGAGIGAGYAYRATPLYRSRATIEIEKIFPTSTNLNDLFSFFGQFDLYYQTQIESLQSRSLVAEFLKRLKKPRSSEAESQKPADAAVASQSDVPTGEPSNPESDSKETDAREHGDDAAISAIVSQITVAPIKGTQLIQVEMGASDPMVAKTMLQTYLDTYIDETRRKRGEIVSRVRAWLNGELAETEKQLRESETKLLEFTKEHGVFFTDKTAIQVLNSFEKANESVLESKEQRINLEARQYEKEKALPANVSNEYLQTLRSKLASLKSEYTGKKAIYAPEYFKMALLKNQIRSMEEAIAEIEKNTLSSAVEEARKKEAVSEETYQKTKQAAMNIKSLSVQYEILKKMVEANSQTYLMLLQKTKQAELDHGIMGHNVSINSSPTLPIAPISPQKNKIILMGAMFGLFGGFVLAVGLAIIDTSAKTPDEIEKHLNLPILGAVPRIERGSGFMQINPKKTRFEFMAHEFPSSPFTDSVRIIQNTISTRIPADTGSSMMCISSALPLEGKTLVSVVVATVISSEQKKVLVIDCDLRRPRIHEVFNSDPVATGLSDLITGKCVDIKDAIRKSHIPGLFYMTSGTTPDNPVPMLKTKTLGQIFEACRKTFDYVILDAPPVLGLVDATILSGYADGLVLVMKAGKTPVELLRQAKDSVFRGQGRVLGIVLNMAGGKSSGYSYYRYGHGRYGYHYHKYYQKRSA
ncbi:MAG: polysaccharide biosynthesis tyrosine autokinase [Desulfomonilaceae bacterium]